MSKGSAPRPFSVSNAEYSQRWDAIFGKDKTDACPKCNHSDLRSYRTTSGGMNVCVVECENCGHIVDIDGAD